jgi:hypothetical protein
MIAQKHEKFRVYYGKLLLTVRVNKRPSINSYPEPQQQTPLPHIHFFIVNLDITLPPIPFRFEFSEKKNIYVFLSYSCVLHVIPVSSCLV